MKTDVLLIVVPGLSNSSSGSDSSTSRTLSRQGSHYSTSSSSSSSSPTASEIQTREREDRIGSDISPVTVSTTVDERSRTRGSVLTGEEPPPHSGELNHAPSPKKVAEPNPSHPALRRLDTTSPWSTDYGGNIFS